MLLVLVARTSMQANNNNNGVGSTADGHNPQMASVTTGPPKYATVISFLGKDFDLVF